VTQNGALVHARLLGPVDVMVDGGPRPVPGSRRKAVLATLALHGGEVVSTGQLVDVVWGNAASPKAVSTLQSHVSFLRSVLGSKAAIVARPPGYLLDLGDGGTDVWLAERLLREGRQAADPVQGVRDLRAALALWRGRPLADVAGSAWLEEQAERLDLLRLQVRRALSQARLAAGEHEQLVPDLEQMAADCPLDEQVHAELMLALYRSGRQADALAVYRRLRHVLDEQVGISPSQMLRDLETAILRQDRALDAPAPAAVLPQVARGIPVPAQLPPAVSGFAGRGAELASLDAVIPQRAGAEPAPPAAVIISAVSGTAGVGKTALAVHWAHRVAAEFPDGQLYVNLRGFDPGGQAMDPGEAVRGFLDAFGVPVARIPQGLAAQAGLYRSLLAGKRVLVVLDNAKDAEQVRPLLPGTPGCLAIVTSRNYLTGLVAAEGARPLALDLLTVAEAGDLLARRLVEGRVAGEPGAVEEIIERCARLPLALAIAAARAAARPGLPLAVVASELREAARALDPFDGDDLATDVRAVFSWSYRVLSAEAARLFRLLGLQPGPDIAVAAAASLAGVPAERTRVLLAELSRAQLLAEHSPGRYAFHDLLRAYANELARTYDSDDTRTTALRRVLDHYLHTAHRAAMLIEPYYAPHTLDRLQSQVIVGFLVTDDDALRWFMAEQAPLLAAVHCAAEAGYGTLTWELAWALSSFLLRRGRWSDHAAVQQAGLDAARRTGDIAGQAHCLFRLGRGCISSGRNLDAAPLLRQALRLFETVGDPFGQAYVHGDLGMLAGRQQQPADSLRHQVRALDLYRAADHPGQAIMLNDIGYTHAVLGNYQRALTYCEQALTAIGELGARNWENSVWDSLGYIHHKLGNHQQAIACYQRSIDLSRELADRYNEAATLDNLGDAQHSAGDDAAARQAWTEALNIFDEIGHPDGERVRAKLRPSQRPPAHRGQVANGDHITSASRGRRLTAGAEDPLSF
jgi:DNA-binding SARP family transcriptional activator/tetratricopeptide (TPR) repeat protein